jgi:hypothetical protein
VGDSGTAPWHNYMEAMAARDGLSYLLGTLEDLRRPSASFGVSRSFDGSLVDRSPSPKILGLYLCPWGALGRAPPCLARDLAWELIKQTLFP